MSIKCENLKIVRTLFLPTYISQKENSGWLKRIRKYGDLGENFPSNSNGSFFFGTRKSNGIELCQP